MHEAGFDNDSQKLAEKLAELMRYLPRIFVNYGPEQAEMAAKVVQDLERLKLMVETIDTAHDIRGKDTHYLESLMEEDFDFIFDFAHISKTEGLHHRIRRVGESLDGFLPAGKKVKLPMAQDGASAARISDDEGERTFAWDRDKDKLQVVLAMLKRFEGMAPRISHWVEKFGDKAYLLEKAFSSQPLENLVAPAHKNILSEYSYLLLANNNTGEAQGQIFHMVEELFTVEERNGEIKVHCRGCGKDREIVAVPNTSTGRPNGMIVVSSHKCEHCGNRLAVAFPDNKLEDFLDLRDKTAQET